MQSPAPSCSLMEALKRHFVINTSTHFNASLWLNCWKSIKYCRSFLHRIMADFKLNGLCHLTRLACYLTVSKILIHCLCRHIWTHQCKFVLNSLAPGRPGCHFETAIFNLVLLIGIFTSSNDNALIWIPWDFMDDESTLVQVMAWCRQATSHHLSQCWSSSMSPYAVTRPQWVKLIVALVMSYGVSDCGSHSLMHADH